MQAHVNIDLVHLPHILMLHNLLINIKFKSYFV